jgi:glutaredoxin
MARRTLTLYSRAGCHLCEEMLEALRGLPGAERFEIEVVDVDSDPQLARRYGETVPVLARDGRELCRGRIDPAALAPHLAA